MLRFKKMYENLCSEKIETKIAMILGCLFFAFLILQITWGIKPMLVPRCITLIGIFIILRYANNWITSTLLGIIFATTLIDIHLSLTYHDIFFNIATPLIYTLKNTQAVNPDEVFNYIAVISTKERILVLGTIIMISIIFLLKKKEKNRNKIFIYIGIILCLVGPAQGMIRPIGAFLIQHISEREVIKARNNFSFEAQRSSEHLHVYCVIGESVRYDYFQEFLNREEYADLKTKIIVMNKAISPFQYTLSSLPRILSRKPATFSSKIFNEKSIFKLFDEAGFETHVFAKHKPYTVNGTEYTLIFNDAQHFHSYANSSRSINMQDIEMLDGINEITQTDSNLFICTKMECAHFKFAQHYSDSEAEFKPYTPEGPNFPENTKNSYKNACLKILSYLTKLAKITQESNVPTIICFVPDHGITLFDDGKTPYYGCTKSQYHIPVSFIYNDAYMQKFPLEIETLKERSFEKITTLYIFNTLASLAKIKFPSYNPKLDILSANFCPDSIQKTYTFSRETNFEDLP